MSWVDRRTLNHKWQTIWLHILPCNKTPVINGGKFLKVTLKRLGPPVTRLLVQKLIWAIHVLHYWTSVKGLHLQRTISPPLRWRHNDHAGVSNHQPHGCLLNRLFRRKSKKTSKLRVTGLCAGNSPGTGEFPAQMASNAENFSIWWRHHDRRDQ